MAKTAVWDGRSRINLIVDAQDVYLVSFTPKEEKLLVVSVPSNTYVEATYGFGSYPFGAIYDLGELEKNGGEVFTSSAQEFFATPIDGWVKIQGAKFEISDEKTVKKNVLDLLNRSMPFNKEVIMRTNLNFWDAGRLWWQIRKVRFDKIKFLSLIDDPATGNSRFAVLDQLLRPFLIEEGITDESLKVEVLNSTGQAGLGGRISRFINNFGSEVISIGNQEELIDQCIIRVKKDDAKKILAQKLKIFFSCELKEDDFLDSRGDLVFIIGRSYWEKLTQRKK